MKYKRKKEIFLVTLYLQNRYWQLSLAYLKAYFLKCSYLRNLVNIRILAFSPKDSLEEIFVSLTKRSPIIIGFSCYVWNIEKTLKLASLIKQRLSNIKIILGGPEVSSQANYLIAEHAFIDAIVANEGEMTFKEVVESLVGGRNDLSGIPNLVYRANHNSHRIIDTGMQEQIRCLDNIPSPYLSGIIKADRNNASLETMRGCSFACGYCYYHKQFLGLRFFSMERIKKDLQFLLEKNIKNIYLMDPTFNLDLDRAKEILHFFIKHKKYSKLHLELKAELLDEELIALLSKAGVNLLEIGLQSTNRDVLKLVNRSFDAELFKRNITLLNKNNIYYCVQLIMGLPGDNYSSFKKSLDWICVLGIPHIEIFKLMLLPGTYLRSQTHRLGIKYDSRPPYFVLETNSFTRDELQKMNDLRLIVELVFKHPLLRYIFCSLNESMHIGFSTLCQEWDIWMLGKHKKFYSLLKNGKEYFAKDNASKIKILDLAKNFSEYISKKLPAPDN